MTTIDTDLKRTTVQLDTEDRATLRELSELQKTNETDAIRRSIRLARLLLSWQDEGGQIILENGRDRRILMLMP